MQLKIRTRLNPETNEREIESFSCAVSGTDVSPHVLENEVLIHASSVPKRFYTHWFEYVLEGTTLVWSDKIVARNIQAGLTKK